MFKGKIKSLSCHQEVLAIHIWNDFLMCGIGSFLHVFNDTGCLNMKQIFNGHKIHFLRDCLRKDYLFVIGGKNITLIHQESLCDGLTITIEREAVCIDWILDFRHVDRNKIILVNAHNQAELWSYDPLRLSRRVLTEIGSCILYSAALFLLNQCAYIFAGTVFSEVLVWKVELSVENTDCKIMQRIQGHKGVIFSIGIKKEGEYLTICTTSDDRSVRLTRGLLETNCDDWQQKAPLYGHTSRVWKSCFIGDELYTIGEDSLLSCWNKDGILRQLSLHGGGGIRSINQRNKYVITGGGDGGVFNIARTALETEEKCHLVFEDVTQHARKVAIFGVDGIVCLTSRTLAYRRTQGETCLEVDNEMFTNCTDMKISCEGILALSTVCGYVMTINTTAASWQPTLLCVNEHERCDGLFWSGSHLLVQMHTGAMHLFNYVHNQITNIADFSLPNLKQKHVTCFAPIDNGIIRGIVVGGRTGEIYLFTNLHKTHVASFRAHSRLGVSDLKYCPEENIVTSVGCGGWLKETLVSSNKLIPQRSIAVPMVTAVKIVSHSNRRIIVGFHGSKLIIWDVKNRLILATYHCGGGHRSYDFFIHMNKIYFVFIKDKRVYQINFELNVGYHLRNGFHSKVINCLQSKGDMIISGSDDNTIKVSKLQKGDIKEIHTFQQHISGVRSIKLVEKSEGTVLIIAVGGREQLSISEVDTTSGVCRELRNHRNYADTGQSEKITDCRYMCVDCRNWFDTLLIFIGCSDCTLKVYSLANGVLSFDTVLPYTHCLLQVIAFDEWVICFGTDGKALFWNSNLIAHKKSALLEHSISLHQSGINSAVVRKWNDVYHLATGGDDNRLCLTTFNDKCDVLSNWYTDKSHSCQITGLIFHDNWLISTSVDQRVVLHNIEDQNDAHCLWKTECLVTVADVHGLCLLAATSHSLTLCVYGKGIEIVQIDLE